MKLNRLFLASAIFAGLTPSISKADYGNTTSLAISIFSDCLYLAPGAEQENCFDLALAFGDQADQECNDEFLKSLLNVIP